MRGARQIHNGRGIIDGSSSAGWPARLRPMRLRICAQCGYYIWCICAPNVVTNLDRKPDGKRIAAGNLNSPNKQPLVIWTMQMFTSCYSECGLREVPNGGLRLDVRESNRPTTILNNIMSTFALSKGCLFGELKLLLTRCTDLYTSVRNGPKHGPKLDRFWFGADVWKARNKEQIYFFL